MRPTVVLAIAALGVSGLAACTDTRPEPSAAAGTSTDEIRAVRSYRFEPSQVQIDAGSSVTWINEDNFVHDVHLLDEPETTEPLPIGGEATIAFAEAGTYRFECSLHPSQMQGTVIVR